MSTVLAGPDRAHGPADRGRRRRATGWRWVFGSLLVLGLVVVVRTWVVTPFEVVSDSMAPTLPEGSTVLVERVSLTWQDPGYQDLVLFDSPDGPLIKRVVGLEGDTVRIEDAVLQVNGEAVQEPYVDLRTLDGVFFGPVVVGVDEVFVLGDNRFDSIDSRTYGPVPLEAVRGRVVDP